MGQRKRKNRGQRREERRFRVRGERRDPPDIRKLGRALISLAQAEMERQAQAEHQAKARGDDPDGTNAEQPAPREGNDD